MGEFLYYGYAHHHGNQPDGFHNYPVLEDKCAQRCCQQPGWISTGGYIIKSRNSLVIPFGRLYYHCRGSYVFKIILECTYTIAGSLGLFYWLLNQFYRNMDVLLGYYELEIIRNYKLHLWQRVVSLSQPELTA